MLKLYRFAKQALVALTLPGRLLIGHAGTVFDPKGRFV